MLYIYILLTHLSKDKLISLQDELNIYKNINSIPLYHWAMETLNVIYIYISILGRKGLEPSTAIKLLSLQLNPSYLQTEPSFL